MKKVLFVSYSLCHGGAERSLLQTLEALDKEKYDVTLFLCSEKNNDLIGLVPEYVKVIVDKTKPHYFRRPKAIWLNLMRILLSKISKKSGEKYTDKLNEYIHTQKAKHPADTYFKDADFEVVISNDFGFVSEAAYYIKGEKHIAYYRSSKDRKHYVNQKAFSICEKIIAVSPAVKEMLVRSYPEYRDRILVMKDLIDAEKIISLADEKSGKCFTEFASGDLTICSCGRLSKEKGFDLAVGAADILKHHGVNFKWIFVGGGDEREKLERIIKEVSLEDRILITGNLENPFSIIKFCDIYVQPSYEESYGLTIKEAMTLSKPIVSTATFGGKFLLENGEKGVLTDITAESIADGIEKLIADPELMEKFSNVYSIEENRKEKQAYTEAWDSLLS